ncbi:hypothetical protein VC83_04225 [Pseudogymnoascus destructans]|uniref:Protein kinase domain-containing protein n=1 Tax=Pseudogymnoascus destructans TaxID=655981 RepID=A0A177AAN0_9PEZI|nr:uncharacterized protein VC83_04225 [Pseudogymnoascus destructans]OAF59198.1 hypothetical protein VC83_04225 [Pseudogymnoascus destructans]
MSAKTSQDTNPVVEIKYSGSKRGYIGSGASGIVNCAPNGDVVKSPWPGSRAAKARQDITTENLIYKKLGQHPRLIRTLDFDPESCVLTMEYMPNGTLKDFLSVNNEALSTARRLQWAKDAAEGLQFLHDAKVVHCDVEPKNFLLDQNLALKISDFSGSSLEGSRASACAGRRYSRPGFDFHRQQTVSDDLFGLGSTIYFIMTGQIPFEELSSNEVEERYKAQVYPDVSGIKCGSVIRQCWDSEITSAQEVYDYFREMESKE